MDDNNYIEIRQRTEELMRQAYLIWQSSDYAEHLEQLDEDPVFRMLMTAMAYQFNDIDSHIEFAKHEVMNDFANAFIPCNAEMVRPTTVVVENQTSEGIAEVLLDDSSVFTERSSELQFIPLLKTKVVCAQVGKVVRLDGRRWKISVSFPEGVTNLAGFTFAIKELTFRDFSLTINNKEIPLVKPWNQCDLPFTDAFSYVVRLYNKTPIWNVMSICLEHLALQDLAVFCVADSASMITFPDDTRNLDFVVEFNGIDENFVFEKSKLHLNVNVLVNAKINTVTLTQDKPIAKVPGENGQKFMNLLYPSNDHIVGSHSVSVRKVQADRFNLGSLIRLLNCIVAKFHSDYYAFQLLKQQDGDAIIHNIETLLLKLKQMASSVQMDDLDGVYIFVNDDSGRTFKVVPSLDVRYLSTNGALQEDALGENAVFSTPVGLENSSVHQISKPVLGSDNIFENADYESLTSYYVTTSDRLVTPADIRLFCLYKIRAYFSLDKDAFQEVSVVRQPSNDSFVGYEICVRIVLANTSLVRKAVGDRLPRLECLIEKSIEVRSVNIYPVKVSIQFA